MDGNISLENRLELCNSKLSEKEKMKKIQQLLDVTFWKFVLVGIVNTLVGTTVMFVAYNALHLSYWISSASNYIIGSIVSYFLNKYGVRI